MLSIFSLICLVSSGLLQLSVRASPTLPSSIERRIDSSETTPEFVNLTRTIPEFVSVTQRAPPPTTSLHKYNIDCNVRPEVCENQCYYVYCKSGNWIVTVQRTPASRGQSECSGYNRCSHGRKSGPPTGGWANNPNSGWSCDEQPKSSTAQGGAASATRCMVASENSGEGADWSSFINGNSPATAFKKLPDGTDIEVTLSNVNTVGNCASYGTTATTVCALPAQPPSPSEGIRQR